MRRVVAGVDSSTQSCKVELRSVPGFELVASGSAPHPQVSPPSSEQDPEAWWQAFLSAFRHALAAAGDVEVAAISIAGQCHGLVALDADGHVIRPAKLWNDTTSDVELRTLIDVIGQAEFIDRTGSLPTAAFTIGKVAWLVGNEPQNAARLAMMLLPHDYLNFRLTGEFVTDRSEASGTGYFDPDANEYVFEFLHRVDPALGWESMVPRVAGPDEVVGQVLDGPAADLGIHPGVRVGAGAGDQHAAAVGLGLGPGDLCVSLGTSGVAFTPSSDPVRDPSGLINGVAGMPGGFLPLACTLNSTRVTDTFARLLGVSHLELAELALAAGQEGPVLAAFLDGERTPNRPGASGLLAGITAETTREQLARAAFEGVVFGLFNCVRLLEDAGVPTTGAVLAVGGGSRSPAYLQLLADALGRRVDVADAEQAVARGAALQALALAEGRPLVDVMVAHKPARREVAAPRQRSEQRWDRYRQVAAVTELDAQ
ncbi:xylulokinase [Tessaracoccus lapidicaptus]|uniref:Xylulose kinase n=1 Tax=Tessaracoccus lapidicaptus TaxID=1427523 RepID=A0A1C0AGU0_9ACTN|nr:xylulokinase [Tessaracoccus lapidicaptus]OCL30917.1 xylulokinase [Tessaracoccus lapidicaptus]